jgi:hypothetical protein
MTRPIKMIRAATRREVEELLSKQGRTLIEIKQGGFRHLLYREPDGRDTVLQAVRSDERPNWHSMLQKLGSDWA